MGTAERVPAANELLIYSEDGICHLQAGCAVGRSECAAALHDAGIAVQSLACLLASDAQMADASLHEAASALGVPLRFARVTRMPTS